MAHDDPLAEFRRERWQKNDMAPQHEPLTEHQALRLAINALNEIPNSGIRMEGYSNTYALIPELEKAYNASQERTKLEELAPRMYETLLLCEDVLSDLGRLDDGTPSISALIDIRAIKKDAGSLSPEKDKAGIEETNRAPSQDRDIEPER